VWTYLEACNCECSIVEEDDSVADGIDIEEGASARVTALEQLSRKVLLFVAEYAGEEVLVVLFGKGGKAGLGGTTSAAATEWPKARQCVAPFSAANTRRWPAPCRPSLPHCAKHTGGWHCARFLPKANPPKRPLPLSSALSYYNPSLLNRKVEMKCISHLGDLFFMTDSIIKNLHSNLTHCKTVYSFHYSKYFSNSNLTNNQSSNYSSNQHSYRPQSSNRHYPLHSPHQIKHKYPNN